MKKSLIALMLLAAAIAGALVWAANYLGQEAKQVASVRDVMPDSVLYYVEAEDLADTWTAVRGTQAFGDLKDSVLWLDEKSPIQDALATLEDISAKVDYPLDDANLMKFLGRRVALGLTLDAQTETVVGIAATRLDLEALAKDLLAGDMDWRALQTELNTRTQKAEFELVSRDYRGYSVTTARKGEDIVFWTLLEDVLVVSDARSLLDAAIDARIDGRGALSQLAVFNAEVDKLEGSMTAFDWTHLAAIEAQRELAQRCWKEPDGEVLPWLFDPLLDAVKGCPSLARAYDLPGGDLYQAQWRYSRGSADVFVDQSSPVLTSIASPDTKIYFEANRLDDLARSWESSALRKSIGETELARKIESAMDDPQGAIDKALSMSPMPIPGQAPDLGEGSLAFPLRFTWNAVRRGVETLFAGDVAAAVDGVKLGAELPAAVVAIRLGMDGRFAALLGSQTPEARSFGRVGDYTLYGAEPEGQQPAYWTLIGDVMLMGPDLEATRKAGLAMVAGTPAGGMVAEAAARFGDDRRFFGVVDARSLMDDMMGDNPDFPGGFNPGDVYGARYYAFAATVDDDFSRIGFRYDYPISPDASELARVLTLNPRVGQSRLLGLGPQGTMYLFAYNYDAAVWMKALRKFVVDTIGQPEADLDEALGEADEFLGMSLEKDLLPALNGEFGLVLVRTEVDPNAGGQGGPPPVPGVLFALGHSDPVPVQKALDRVVEFIGEQIEQQSGQSGRRTPQMLKEDVSGRLFRRLDLAGEMGPLEPTFGMLDDYVMVAIAPQTVHDLAAVLDDKAPGWRTEPRIARACEGLPDAYSAVSVCDWTGMMRQLEAYVGPLAEMGARVPPPEFPDNGDMQEWQRRQEQYQKDVAAAGKETGDTVRAVLDALTLIESMVSWAGVDGDHATGAAEILFRQAK